MARCALRAWLLHGKPSPRPAYVSAVLSECQTLVHQRGSLCVFVKSSLHKSLCDGAIRCGIVASHDYLHGG